MIRAAALHFNLLPLAFYTPDNPAHNIRGADWIILTHNAAMAAELRNAATQVKIYGDPAPLDRRPQQLVRNHLANVTYR